MMHDGYALHDINVQPVSRNFKPAHPICELPEYAELVNLSPPEKIRHYYVFLAGKAPLVRLYWYRTRNHYNIT